MAKPKEQIKARKLRKQGVSVKEIARRLGVAKGTVSLWVRDIILTIEQLEVLRKRQISGANRGRIVNALKQKEVRLKKIKTAQNKGDEKFDKISIQELFISGLALYWAEGAKKQRRVSFCNSDPRMIKFMILWLRKCFKIPPNRLSCYVGINEIHAGREKLVKSYWSKMTGIPVSQFTKTSLKKTKNKKIYENYHKHYGTLTVIVKKPAELYYDILGYIHGLSHSRV